jgi:hypothetical protein
MPLEFGIIFDEFAAELDALTEMAKSAPDSGGSGAAGLTARARIAVANGATLLLAATFEEFIRQQVREAFRSKAKHAKSFADFPAKIVRTVWRQSLEGLARTPFEDIETKGSAIDARVAATLAFCLRREMAADVSESLSHNDHNMRPQELHRLFSQIGFPSIIAKVAEDESLIEILSADTPGKASSLVEARLNDFFRRRNAIAHAIELGSSSGPSQLIQDIELLRIFGRALAMRLQTIVQTLAEPAHEVA